MFKLTLRNIFARKVRLVMSSLAIVLGVGFLAGVMTFSHGLSSTFDNIIEGSTSDGLVRPTGTNSFDGTGAGNTATVSPADVRKLAALPEVAAAHGNVDGLGMFLLDENKKLVGGNGAPTLAFNYSDADNMAGEPVMELDSGTWPTRPDQVVLDSNAAENGGYRVGDRVSVIAPFGKPLRTFELAGTANFNGGGTAGAILVLFSTEGAQDVFLGGRDVFTSVSLTAADGVTQQQLADAAQAVAPQGYSAVTGDTVVSESQDAIGEFLGVISTFLLVFAVIAIVVGAFIIANTFNILVAQRVRELALLRALGAARRQVTRSVLLEALVMALIAATVGIGVGWALARGLAAMFRAFGLDIAGDALTLTPGTIGLAYLVGVGVTMVAAYIPARRAAKVPPVAAMRDDHVMVEASLRRRTLLGAVALVIGAALAVIGVGGGPGNDAAWIGAGALIWVVTVAATSSIIGKPVLVLCRSLFSRVFGMSGRLAGENALRNPRRTGATASALMIGLALVSAIGVLAASMNKSVDTLVDDQFTPDYLVQGPNFASFPTAVGDAVAAVPGVEQVSRQQFTAAKVDGETTYVSAVDGAFGSIYDLKVESGTSSFSGREAVLTASEAKSLDAAVGDQIKLGFAGVGDVAVRVVGIFEDTPVTGGITVPMRLLEDAGVNRQDSSISIVAEPGTDLGALHKELDTAIEAFPIVSVQDKQEFAEGIRGQVNQLLYMIYGLLALAIVIAVIGIINTLGLSVIERTREIGLLRAIGLSRSKLRRMVTLESVAIAVLGSVLGLAVGVVIGVLLRYALRDDLTVLALPWTLLLWFLVIAVVVGVLAAVVPAIRAARLNVLRAIATE